MYDEGTLSIVRDTTGYQVRYAANNYHHQERPAQTCADEGHLTGLLSTCGLDSWSIQQAWAELQDGRMAVVPIACTLQPHQHGRPSPWGEDDAWWRHPDQGSPYHGAVGFMATRPTTIPNRGDGDDEGLRAPPSPTPRRDPRLLSVPTSDGERTAGGACGGVRHSHAARPGGLYSPGLGGAG